MVNFSSILRYLVPGVHLSKIGTNQLQKHSYYLMNMHSIHQLWGFLITWELNSMELALFKISTQEEKEMDYWSMCVVSTMIA